MQAQPQVAGDVNARAIDPRTAFVMDDLLKGVATAGTAARARTLNRGDVAGKTGTTNHSVDAWFAGYAATQVAVAWLGYDQPQSLGERVTGGGAALPIWMGYMTQVLKGKSERPAIPPGGLLRVDGDYYFKEFPPGQAIATLGVDVEALFSPDSMQPTPLTDPGIDPVEADPLRELLRTLPVAPNDHWLDTGA